MNEKFKQDGIEEEPREINGCLFGSECLMCFRSHYISECHTEEMVKYVEKKLAEKINEKGI